VKLTFHGTRACCTSEFVPTCMLLLVQLRGNGEYAIVVLATEVVHQREEGRDGCSRTGFW
jgi:hypothetical protein